MTPTLLCLHRVIVIQKQWYAVVLVIMILFDPICFWYLTGDHHWYDNTLQDIAMVTPERQLEYQPRPNCFSKFSQMWFLFSFNTTAIIILTTIVMMMLYLVIDKISFLESSTFYFNLSWFADSVNLHSISSQVTSRFCDCDPRFIQIFGGDGKMDFLMLENINTKSAYHDIAWNMHDISSPQSHWLIEI